MAPAYRAATASRLWALSASSRTHWLCRCRTPPAGHVFPGTSTAPACSLRLSRGARIGQSVRSSHRRSCGSGTASRPAPPASRVRWYPTAPAPRGNSAAVSTGVPPRPSGAAPATIRLPSSISAAFRGRSGSHASLPGTRSPASGRNRDKSPATECRQSSRASLAASSVSTPARADREGRPCPLFPATRVTAASPAAR